jgi:hypothetical protein
MAETLTNQRLQDLLRWLGFQPGDPTERGARAWRHPRSGCVLILPANKLTERPRPADLIGIEGQLASQGHLDAAEFERFVATGNLPAGAGEVRQSAL